MTDTLQKMMEFDPFPKLARLSRQCTITEKIDGTNAQIFIELWDNISQLELAHFPIRVDPIEHEGIKYLMLAGSRTRWISVKDDNHGFAKFVEANKQELVKLGPGRHFGEWWGSGIQRGYGKVGGEKHFSLFNTNRWGVTRDMSKYPLSEPACCSVVPVLYEGLFDTVAINAEVEKMRVVGSTAAPGFMKPEGIVVFHSASGQSFKKTLEKDEMPKGLAGLS